MNRLLTTLKRRSHPEHGFTLMELLIVIVIIGILAAIAVPIFSNQIKEGKKTALTQELRGAVDEMNELWNEDEGYPTAFSQKFSDGTTATLYGDGEFIRTEGGTTTDPNGSGSTPGTGNSGGTGSTPGNGDGTFKPSTNRQLTWAEFQAANKYDTGVPFAAQGVRHGAGKAGNGMSFDFNYTASKISSSAELMDVLREDCSTVYFGYNRFLPPRTSADEQGRNVCAYLRESDALFTSEEAFASLSVFKLTSTSQKEWSVNAESGTYGSTLSVPYEPVVDWSYPSTGTYTIVITKSPTDLIDNCSFGKVDIDGDGSVDRFPRQGEEFGFPCADYGNGYDTAYLNSRHLYDITILYTSTMNQAFSGRPYITGSFAVNKDVYVNSGTYDYISSQGGRYCPDVVVGSNDDCGNNYNGPQFSMTDDLPESWWANYLNGTGGNSGGTNTNPSTDGANGGVRADASNNTYVASYCIEAYNADIDVWLFYASDQQKVKEGQCPQV